MTLRSIGRRALCAYALAVSCAAILVAGIPGVHAVPCPTQVRFDATSSSADLGWTGIAHDQDLGELHLQMSVSTCVGVDLGSCGECYLGGPFGVGGGRNRRCRGDLSVQCTSDVDCGADAPCVLYASPPQSISTGGISFCLANSFAGAVVGTVNPDDGTLAAEVPLQTDMYVGILVSQGCPTCVAGVCNGGERDGLACQVDATDASFGPTSFDCPPATVTIIGAALRGPVTLATGTQTNTLTAASPACRAFGYTGQRCFCDTCNDAAATPCMSSADCVDVGATICGGKRCLGGTNQGAACAASSECPGGVCGVAGAQTAFSSCLFPGSCVATTGNEGECTDGPLDSYCSIESYRGCLSAADCSPPSCADCQPGQTCEPKLRECFTDNGVVGGSISVTGSASPPIGSAAATSLGGLTCSAVTGSSAVNAGAGFPGPIRLRFDGTLTFSGVPSPCPSAMEFDVDDGAARADFGWTGLVHDEPLTGWKLRLGVDNCAGSEQPGCGQCDITGLLPTGGGGNKRCVGDTSIVCEVDGDCGAAAPCHFFASPPMPLSAGGVGACFVNEIVGAVTGTVNVDDGSIGTTLPVDLGIYVGVTVDQPCPTCVAGSCVGGSRHGSACTANASSAAFGDTSFDCPPSPGAKIGDLNVQPVVGTTDTQTAILSAASPNCRALGHGSQRCFCDTCNNAAATPCMSNADCVAVGATVCGGKRCVGGTNQGAACAVNSECPSGGACLVPGLGTAPNACPDPDGAPDGCQPISASEGECADGPVEQYCDEPESYRGCSTPTQATDCPITGSCGIVKIRSCYLDNGVIGGSVSITGAASPPFANEAFPTLAGMFCTPPAAAAAANSVSGWPGLSRLRLPGHLTLADEVVANVGTSATTDGEADGATPTDPVESTVTSPSAGEIVITETFLGGPTPPGYTFLGRQVQISAPAASAGSPLALVFRIDGTAIPAGETVDTIQVFRNGARVLKCTGAPQAIPDPCVSSRVLVGDDAEITVLTSAASDWNFGVAAPAECPPVPDPSCRLPFVSQKAQLQIKNTGDPAKNQISWKWLKGVTTLESEYGEPTASDSYALCIYDNGTLISSTAMPAAGTCAGKPCWSDKTTSLKYNDKDLTPDGASQLQLKQGLEDGKAQIQFKGKGANLETPAIGSLTGPTIAVRLHKSSGAPCWGANFSAPFDKLDAAKGQFKDKAD